MDVTVSITIMEQEDVLAMVRGRLGTLRKGSCFLVHNLPRVACDTLINLLCTYFREFTQREMQ